MTRIQKTFKEVAKKMGKKTKEVMKLMLIFI